MTDDRFDQLLDDLRDEHNAPPETPRDEMWAKIEEAHGQRAQRRRFTHTMRPFWPVAAAAILLLGIWLGRVSREAPSLPVVDPTPTSNPSVQLESPRLNPFSIVAARHLDRAEALLTHFESGNAPSVAREQMLDWARELLNDTCLILDSPAGSEPAMRDLLADVELLLTLVIHMDDEPRAIADGLRNSGVLERLRSRIPADNV